jgi:hypothetical protein
MNKKLLIDPYLIRDKRAVISGYGMMKWYPNGWRLRFMSRKLAPYKAKELRFNKSCLSPIMLDSFKHTQQLNFIKLFNK